MISTVEIIECTSSVITITDSVDTVTMDGACKEMEVVVTPQLRERIKLVTTFDCTGIKLTVRDAPTATAPATGTAGTAPTANGTDHKSVATTYAVVFPSPAADKKAGDNKSTPAESEADRASPVQYVTRWHDPVAEAAAAAKQSGKAGSGGGAATAAASSTAIVPGWITEKLQRRGIGLITNL